MKLTEIFLVKSAIGKTFVAEIFENDRANVITGKVNVNDLNIISSASTQKELGEKLDEMATFALLYDLKKIK